MQYPQMGCILPLAMAGNNTIDMVNQNVLTFAYTSELGFVSCFGYQLLLIMIYYYIQVFI